MSDNDFKIWLDKEINTTPPDWFDENGNSSRATVMRMRKGLFNALVYEHKHYLKSIRYWWSSFDGLRTELGWFVQIPFIPLFIVFGGLARTYFNYKRAIDDYKQDFERSKLK